MERRENGYRMSKNDNSSVLLERARGALMQTDSRFVFRVARYADNHFVSNQQQSWQWHANNSRY